jgi:hypothetical protein
MECSGFSVTDSAVSKSASVVSFVRLPHTCYLCSSGFRLASDLSLHLRGHRHDSRLACAHCRTQASSCTQLWRHLAAAHPHAVVTECTLCDRRFGQNAAFHLHMLAHIGEVGETCSACGKTFGSRPALRKHQVTHSGTKRLECSICQARFKSRDELRQHALSHAGLKAFECALCAGKFKYLASLKRHEKKGRCRAAKPWLNPKPETPFVGLNEAQRPDFSDYEDWLDVRDFPPLYDDVFFGCSDQKHYPVSPLRDQLFSF